MTDGAVDGILGLGQQRLSIISQLSSHGISPKSFSHCLKGEGSGGGILVLGEILHPSMVYTPLAPSKYVLQFSTALFFSTFYKLLLFFCHDI